jgi:hypothetical protein
MARAAAARSNRAQVSPQISFTNSAHASRFSGNDDLPRTGPHRFGTVTEHSGGDSQTARRPPTVSIAQFDPNSIGRFRACFWSTVKPDPTVGVGHDFLTPRRACPILKATGDKNSGSATARWS